MTEKFRKIDREYVLSDSTVNEYGFRLLTSGYQLEQFQKNPIGYYMHRREDGIVLKWDELRIDGDRVTGKPVVNLSHPRGEQTCSEAENGFLNAASVGHIVVVEYSTDPELMLPGQTGPTITKWYNKECSLVDIPGNGNALTRLFDEQENELNLTDMNPVQMHLVAQQAVMVKELCTSLETDEKHALQLPEIINDLKARHEQALAENLLLKTETQQLHQRVKELTHAQNIAEVESLLTRALEDRKITVELRNKLATDYAGNATGLGALLAAMPAYQSILTHLKGKTDEAPAEWQWDDYDRNDPSGRKLASLRANDPARYKELFDKKFNS